MDRILDENLLDGEQILWKGRSVPFKLFAPPYSRFLPLLWTASIGILMLFSLLFVPLARRVALDPLQMVFWILLVSLVPISIGIHSLRDKRMIERHMLYIFTNYRAITLTPGRIHSMLINASTPCRLEALPDGSEILYIGDACNTRSCTSRANAVAGIHENGRDTNRVTGLVFYGLKNAREICSKYTPFVEL